MGSRWIVYLISEMEETFDIPLTTVCHMYQEYLMLGIITHRRQHGDRTRVFDKW